MMNIRKEVYEKLYKILFENGYSNVLLADGEGLTDRDFRFLRHNVLGVLEEFYWLKHVISKESDKSWNKMDREVKLILLMGAFDILVNTSPSYAAINENVKLCSLAQVKSAKGFVNAILREIDRKKDEYIREKATLPLSLKFSLPAWVIKEWKELFPDQDIEKILIKTRKVPETYIFIISSIASEKTVVENLLSEGILLEKKGCLTYLVKTPHKLFMTESFKQGLFRVMDLSSIEVGNLVSPKCDDKVLDMCAAPGGKSVIMLNEMSKDGQLISCDMFPKKLDDLRNGLAQLPNKNWKVQNQDATILDKNLLSSFDKVLVDAPCSGLGIIGRRPEIALNRNSLDIDSLSAIQRKIIKNGIRYLKIGGEMTYSVCTWTKKETLDHYRWLKDEKNLEIIPIDGADYKFLGLEDDEGDGFFAMKLKRVM